MSKYSVELKLEVVKYCVEKYHSYAETAKYFNIRDKKAVSKWVKLYKEFGIKGLMKKSQKYDGAFKKNVIEYMHQNHLSLRETAIKFNLGSHTTIGKWEQIYYEEGEQALFEEPKWGKIKMSIKPNKQKKSKDTEETLEEEVERLRMENEYLKKLNALVQERIKQENKKK